MPFNVSQKTARAANRKRCSLVISCYKGDMKELDKLFKEPGPSGQVRPFREVYLAAAALLVDLSHMDGKYVFQERSRILRLLRENFDIPHKAVVAIADYAEGLRGDTSDMFTATRQVRQDFTKDEIRKLMHMLFDVMAADGVLHKQEKVFIEGVTQLLGVDAKEMEKLEAEMRRKLKM